MKTSQMAFLNEAMDWVVEEGYVTLLIGASSQDIRLKDRVKIRDTKVIDQKQRGFYAEAEAAQ